ncbi:MAG: metallophosphoesterase [Clostridiales bacterium]|jgi:predicted phosphodiesterase|nr:metallophosphoesterase [Clostridiales bacterium]
MNLFKRLLLYILTAFAAADAILNYACFRIGYVQIDHELFNGFCYMLLGIMFLNAAFLLFCSIFYTKKKTKPHLAIKIIFIFNALLTFLFTVVNYVTLDLAKGEATLILFMNALPLIIAVVAVPFLLFAFPKIEAKKRTVIAVILCTVFAASILSSVFKVFPLEFKFESQPLVLDIGTGDYSVVWSTNADSVGYLEYTYAGEDYIVYSIDEGNKKAGRVHSAIVPREHLENNAYSVHSSKVLDLLPYGGLLGKTIDSKTYNFKGARDGGADINIQSYSDWHQLTDLLLQTSSYLDKADLVLLMGDYADYYVSEQQVINNVLLGGGLVTNSEVPAIFVKGNHETRSDGLFKLWQSLGIDRMYYQVERGPYMFTVLDTGEGDSDDFWEQGPYNAFEQYMAIETEWFNSLPDNNGLYNIVLLHNRSYSPYSDFNEIYRQKLLDMDVKLTVSGHSHAMRLTYERTNAYYMLEDGGRNSAEGNVSILDLILGSKKRNIENFKRLFANVQYYFASQITFSGNDVIFLGYDNLGNVLLDKTKDKYPVIVDPCDMCEDCDPSCADCEKCAPDPDAITDPTDPEYEDPCEKCPGCAMHDPKPTPAE